MNRKEKAAFVQRVLNDLFPVPEIPLHHKDPYTLLIAVLLSARCTDKRVNLTTPALFQKASTPEEMIKLSVKEIQTIIKPCGLSPFKARSIWSLSQILIEKHNSQVPRDFESLEALPGVGHKTASVVMCQAFDLPAFPIDTHIHRCAKRWGLSKARNVNQTERDLKKVFRKKDWNRLHLQIIHYARAYCPSRKHNVDQCLICKRLELSQ
jgi:endonuclease-3